MPAELLTFKWKKGSGSNVVNVLAIIAFNTDLSNLVIDTILQYEDVKKRALTIKHWIKIADKCLELNNYDSLMAIIVGLTNSCIERLKRTWDIISQKRKDMLAGMKAIIDSDKNWSTLRSRVRDRVPPCLPFVGTYLTDLTMLDDGNGATREIPGVAGNERMAVINFDKYTKLAKIIGDLQRFQIPCRLTENPEMQEWIQAQLVRVKAIKAHEEFLLFYSKSCVLEPKDPHPKGSPIEGQSNFSSVSSREKFDIFAWTHSRDKTSVPATPI